MHVGAFSKQTSNSRGAPTRRGNAILLARSPARVPRWNLRVGGPGAGTAPPRAAGWARRGGGGGGVGGRLRSGDGERRHSWEQVEQVRERERECCTRAAARASPPTAASPAPPVATAQASAPLGAPLNLIHSGTLAACVLRQLRRRVSFLQLGPSSRTLARCHRHRFSCSQSPRPYLLGCRPGAAVHATKEWIGLVVPPDSLAQASDTLGFLLLVDRGAAGRTCAYLSRQPPGAIQWAALGLGSDFYAAIRSNTHLSICRCRDL